MGKLQAFEIVFDGQGDVFKPGDTITGCVRIVLTEEKGDIRGIKVRCIGKAYTHWTEQHGSGDNRHTVHYSWKVSYIKQEIILRGAGKGNKTASRMTLPAGDHRFPFQFQIPQQSMPPPFEGTVGWVRYYIKAAIDRPWKFDHKTQRFFSIWTVKDLNQQPNIFHTPNGEVEKTVCCLCCESGPVCVKAHIDKSGYAPGEKILVSLELNNQSNRSISSLTVALYQMVVYRAKHGGSVHTRKSNKKITELQLEGCDESGSITLDRRPMLIPPVAPNSFENCPNIDVAYVVKIEADVSGTPIDAKITLPLVIGTIPAFPQFAGYAPQPGIPAGVPPQQPGYPPPQQPGYPPQQPGYPPQQPGYPPQPAQPQAGYPPQPDQPQAGYPPQTGMPQPGYPPPQPAAQGYPPAGAQPSAPYLPPPTYEMAVGGPQEIAGDKGTFGTISYAPRYPYYNPETMYQAMGQPEGPPQGKPPAQGPVMTQPQGQPQAPQVPYPQPEKEPMLSKEYPPV